MDDSNLQETELNSRMKKCYAMVHVMYPISKDKYVP